MSGAWCTSCTFGTISMLRVVCVAITLSGVWAGVNEASKKILEENARRLGVVTLEPGLQYRILPEGHCEHSCLAGTLCQFHYAEAERRATISVIEKVDESKQKKSDFMCTCRMPITFASSQTDGNERNEIDIAWQRGTLTTSAPSQADENRRHELDSTQNRASFNTFAPSEVYDFARPARAPTISVGGKNLRLYHRARVAFRTTRRSRRKEELRRRKHRRHLRLVMAALLAAKQIQPCFCRRWEKALQLHQQTQSFDSLEERLRCTNSAITACGRGIAWPTAMQLFEEIQRPSLVTHNALLSALAEGSQWQLALQVFKSLPQKKITPTVVTLNSVLHALCRGSHHVAAQRLLGRMPSYSLTADLYSYTTVMSACTSVSCLSLPSELRHLTLPHSFDQELDHVWWPPNLLSLTLGTRFNRDLRAVKFPMTLESLSFGLCFQQSLKPVYERLPKLKRLRFEGFRPLDLKQFIRLEQLDVPIARCEEFTMLPTTLRSLTIRGCKDFRPESLEPLIKLETLKIFGSGNCMAHVMVEEVVQWPESLRSMTFGETLGFDVTSTDMQLPSGLEELNLRSGKIWNLQFPGSLVTLDLGELFYPNLHELSQLPNLQRLTLGRSARIVFPLPSSLRSLHLRDSQGPQPSAMPLPELEELDLGSSTDEFSSGNRGFHEQIMEMS
eukprot:s1359_g5.t2